MTKRKKLKKGQLGLIIRPDYTYVVEIKTVAETKSKVNGFTPDEIWFDEVEEL